jgi:hypothetical protein
LFSWLPLRRKILRRLFWEIVEMARSGFYGSPRRGVLKKFDQNFCLYSLIGTVIHDALRHPEIMKIV